MTLRIAVLDGQTLNPGDLSWDALAEFGRVTVHPRSGPLVLEHARGADVLLTNKEVLDAPTLAALPDVRYVGVTATGTNVVDLDACRARGVVVTNVPGYATESVAQLVFAGVLGLYSRVDEHARAVAAGAWQTCPDFSFTLGPTHDLADRRLGIVGLGTIGSRVARIGAAFGMRVAAATLQSSRPDAGVPVAWLDLPELLASSDVISLHCPLTPGTRGLLDAERLALCKPTAIVVNTGRGPLVDEAALAAALRAGRLGGAVLDVLQAEPPRAGSPVIGAPRCLVTPHLGWASLQARQRLLAGVVENLRAWRAGSPIHRVA